MTKKVSKQIHKLTILAFDNVKLKLQRQVRVEAVTKTAVSLLNCCCGAAIFFFFFALFEQIALVAPQNTKRRHMFM